MPATFKTPAVLLCTLAAAVAAILAVFSLQADATTSRNAEQRLMSLRVDLHQIADVPWGASPDEGGAKAEVREELIYMQERLDDGLERLRDDGNFPEYEQATAPLGKAMRALWNVFDLVAAGRGDDADEFGSTAAYAIYDADAVLEKAAKRYRADSTSTLRVSRIGSALVVGLLFAAFAFFFWRAARARRAAEALSEEKQALLAASREEALTDALTGLGNRRAMLADVRRIAPAPDERVALAVFDLDGFKQYNDAFGHPAGDALLQRLGDRLRTTMDGIGRAYRMGGDEFCVVATVTDGGAQAIAALAASALSEDGTGFQIRCSFGVVELPNETTDPDVALLLADQRMYEQKTSGRVPASRQVADVLLRILAERDECLDEHTRSVTDLADRTARTFGLAGPEIERIRLGAELHDIGKVAIPDAILSKPGPLDDDEWAFMRCHTLIGERIVKAAPALASTAELVRASHERYDGAGYPDRLAGEQIPLGARIVAVCDAFDAMVSERPYRSARTVGEALAELHRCAGTQFDPAVVASFSRIATEDGAALPQARRADSRKKTAPSAM